MSENVEGELSAVRKRALLELFEGAKPLSTLRDMKAIAHCSAFGWVDRTDGWAFLTKAGMQVALRYGLHLPNVQEALLKEPTTRKRRAKR
jgi:hypothetical protein